MMFVRITYHHVTGELVAVETSQRPFKAAAPTMSLHAAGDDGQGEEISPLNTLCVGLVRFADDDAGEAGLVHAWLAGVDCRDREAVRAAVAMHRKIYPSPTHVGGLSRGAAGLPSVVRAWALCTAPDAPGAALWRVSTPLSAIKACEVQRMKRSPDGHRLYGMERALQQSSDMRSAKALARRHANMDRAAASAWDDMLAAIGENT